SVGRFLRLRPPSPSASWRAQPLRHQRSDDPKRRVNQEKIKCVGRTFGQAEHTDAAHGRENKIERQDGREKIEPADQIIMVFPAPRDQGEGYAPKSAPEQWLINSRRNKLRCTGHGKVRGNAN